MGSALSDGVRTIEFPREILVGIITGLLIVEQTGEVYGIIECGILRV